MKVLDLEKLYYWELEFLDGVTWNRKQNVMVQGTREHVDPENPPRQAKRITLISNSEFPSISCDIPMGAKPICYWTVYSYLMRYPINVIYYLGYRINGEKFYRKYNYKGEEIGFERINK